MKRESLVKLHKDINDLYYRLFDSLSQDERAALSNTLSELKELIKGDF